MPRMKPCATMWMWMWMGDGEGCDGVDGQRIGQPRADMPGFVPCATDRARDEKYMRRLAAELRSREALRTGRKVYEQEESRGN